jgi:hypothetical protein
MFSVDVKKGRASWPTVEMLVTAPEGKINAVIVEMVRY